MIYQNNLITGWRKKVTESSNIAKVNQIVKDLKEYFKQEEMDINATKVVMQQLTEESDTDTIFEIYLAKVHDDIIDVTTMV